MINVDVRVDVAQMKRSLNAIERKLVPRAAANAINKTAITARKVGDQRIRQRFNLKSAVVKANITIKRAGSSHLIAVIEASGKPIALKDYAARATRKGVTYRISKVRGRRLYTAKGQLGFIVSSLGGHVYVRKGPEPKGPATVGIRKVFGPSLPQYFVTRLVRQAMMSSIQETWPKRFKEAMDFQLLRSRGQL